MDELLKNSSILDGAIAGVSVREASTGEIIYEHYGEQRLTPASNMKLLTAAAALNTLGENYRFKTEILSDGVVSRNTLKGNLYLKGYGDPTLMKSDFDRMAKELKGKGISLVEGNLVGDDTWYDHDRYSQDLTVTDESYYYGGQISALTVSPNKDYDAGAMIVNVLPGAEIGDPTTVKIYPQTDYIKIINHAVTVSPDGENTLEIKREHGKNTVIIEGTIPMGDLKEKEWIAVWEPTIYALDLFHQSLKEQGIKLNGKVKNGLMPANTEIIVSHSSMPLSKLLIPFMKLSNNIHAETLVKEMGKVVEGEGSWDKGLEVLNHSVATFGIDTRNLLIRDGSGISHVNLIPANEITKLLYSIQKKRWFLAYLNSLPTSGVSDKMIGGTLRNRLNKDSIKGKVRAKTGSVSTVSSLSGYIETINGNKMVFSILLNHLLDETKGKKVEDQIVSIISNY